MKKFVLNPIAVCSWSLLPANLQELVAQLKATGVSRVQLALDPCRELPALWGGAGVLCRQNGIAIVSGMFGCVGEDYSTPETIRATGGLVPESTWEENWNNIQATAATAANLRLKLVTFHAGFIPHDSDDPQFHQLLDRATRVADLFATRGIELGLETGQETAETLKLFLTILNRPNVGVNFDPANMILYDKGDPIAALRELGPWLKQCHIKDARRSKTPGTWGQEVLVGTGEVDWVAFFEVLAELKFRGCLAIEREAGNQRAEDIIAARRYIESLSHD
jgi:L-ribulose-5-phosphate 3-epimerase